MKLTPPLRKVSDLAQLKKSIKMNFKPKSNEKYISSKSGNRRFDGVKLCAVGLPHVWKMTKTLKIVISIICLISGWLMIGIGYTTKISHPTSTVLFLLGITCFFIGCIWVIVSIKSTKKLK